MKVSKHDRAILEAVAEAGRLCAQEIISRPRWGSARPKSCRSFPLSTASGRRGL